jgi:photosystem II stability/assembly factor-like uncharacterized protein
MTKSRTDASHCILSPFQTSWFRRLSILVCFAVISCLCANRSIGQPSTWSISEFQPNIQQGGRANTFAVYPTSNNIIFVTSESGGLFRSQDSGIHWQHIDSLPCTATNSVAFVPRRVPTDPPMLIVTTSDDFKVTSGGGIWISTDSGRNWTHSTITLPPGIPERISAYEISIVPDGSAIYVAMDFGSLMSTNRGASWTYQDVFGAGDRRTISILALGNNRVIAGGPSGVRRSIDGGATWSAPATTTVWSIGDRDIHAFGRSPISPQQAFVVDAWTRLFSSEDGGASWTQIAAAPAGGGSCGGIAFIKAVVRTVTQLDRNLQLYFGNRCGAARLIAPINSATGIPDFGGAWQNLSMDHGDTRDLAFDDATNSLMLATDGGLHKTTDGGDHWGFVGGGGGGYNALQITEVKGQTIEDIHRDDLYFGTQDNHVWASSDGGATWPSAVGGEGFYIEAQRRVATTADSAITFVACGNPCANLVSDTLLVNTRGWPNPTGLVAGNPVSLDRARHLQLVDNSTDFSKGLAITTGLGTSWRQYATFDVSPPLITRGLAKLGRPGTESVSLIAYQPYHAGFDSGSEIQHLMLIHQPPRAAAATLYFPLMRNFGGLGINRTMFAWYQVFAIDPGDPLHIIAPDIINRRVMETTNGGGDWDPVPELANLASDGGRLLFGKEFYPNISAISFSPQNPRYVLAGTLEGGIYFSINNGRHWERIPGSEVVTNITSFYWRGENDVIISSYGRGLWRLGGQVIDPSFTFEILCIAPCFERSIVLDKQKPDPKTALLLYGGRVLGAKTTAGVLSEVFVTPGSSVMFTGTSRQQTQKLKVTETDKTVGFGSFQSLSFQPPKSGWIIKGLVFDNDYRLKGVVFGDKPMVMPQPRSPQEPNLKAPTKFPPADKPYLQIFTKRFHGGPTATPDEIIQITGTNFAPNAVLLVVIDGQPPSDKIQADSKGAFKAEIRAPHAMGMHRLEIRGGQGEKTLDGSMLLVTHLDQFEGPNPKPK